MARTDVNPDFRDLLHALSGERVEFLIVGGYAVMFFTGPRFTKDLDVWVRPTRANAERVLRGLRKFGAPRFALTVDELVDPETVFQMGVPPNRIDILTDLDSVTFADAWKRRTPTTYGGVRVSMLGLEDLLANKRAVARPMDLIDAENLQRAKDNPKIGKPRRPTPKVATKKRR